MRACRATSARSFCQKAKEVETLTPSTESLSDFVLPSSARAAAALAAPCREWPRSSMCLGVPGLLSSSG